MRGGDFHMSHVTEFNLKQKKLPFQGCLNLKQLQFPIFFQTTKIQNKPPIKKSY